MTMMSYVRMRGGVFPLKGGWAVGGFCTRKFAFVVAQFFFVFHTIFTFCLFLFAFIFRTFSNSQRTRTNTGKARIVLPCFQPFSMLLATIFTREKYSKKIYINFRKVYCNVFLVIILCGAKPGQ